MDPDRSRRLEQRLNPLHCGAVVASRLPGTGALSRSHVSIPFIAGQWSLLAAILDGSPDTTRVSIPFIAGQWSLRVPPPAGGDAARRVSIPFIAGQWSLPSETPPACGRRGWSQSPSLRGSGRFEAVLVVVALAGAGLNPLHCGAVVASNGGCSCCRGAGGVSIPFIAGQWSLRRKWSRGKRRRSASQSPSLRGSGRFTPSPPEGGGRAVWSQSPSLRGSGRFRRGPRRKNARSAKSQSPSLRGSGRFIAPPFARSSAASCLNPLHCGAVVASRCAAPCQRSTRSVSIPFIAGQWSLLVFAGRRHGGTACLNPLHCGAVVASLSRAVPTLNQERVSIPFIAGQWSLPH